jgi:hypothetical protein
MYDLLEITCPLIGFVILALGAAAYLLYNTVAVKGEPDVPARAVVTNPGSPAPTPQRLRFEVRAPRVKTILLLVAIIAGYSVPAWLLIAEYHRVRHTTVHFVDAVTGQPVNRPLSSVPPDPKLIDPNTPGVIVHYNPPGVAEITWRHGDFMTVTVAGYQTWGGDMDDLGLPADATVKLTPVVSVDGVRVPGTVPATSPSGSTVPAGN